MESLVASLIAFIVTNLDDIFILILFFSDRNLKHRNIITGQFLGISTLILLSFLDPLSVLSLTLSMLVYWE